MISEIAIQVITICGMAIGGLAFGICLGLGMWISGVRMTLATIERKDPDQ